MKLPPPSRTEDIASTTIGIPKADPNNFLVGSEDGNIYSYNRVSRTNAKAGLSLATTPSGHFAPVSGISFHPSNSPIDLTDLILSSSLDWTVKLWRLKKPADINCRTDGTSAVSNISLENLAEFSGADAMYDVAWSPVRCGVFASTGCAGTVDIWDITVETGAPIATNRVNSTNGAPESLNKLAWDKKEGKLLAVGGLSAVLTLFDVGRNLSVVKPGEWTGMRKLIASQKVVVSNA